MPTCWGYARRSTEYEEQAESLTRQESRIREKFEQIARENPQLKMGRVFCETESATMTAYTDRPECMAMLHSLKNGDVVIVENLERLDRNGIRQVDCLRELQKRKVVLWVLDNLFFPSGIDLNSYYGQAMVLASAMQTVQWGQRASEGRKRSIAHLKKEGLPYTTYPPLGFKWSEDDQEKSRWVPDFEARTVIREIVLRRTGAWYATPLKRESWRVLAREMADRKVYLAGTRGKSNSAYKTPSEKHRTRRYLARYAVSEKTGRQKIIAYPMRRAFRQYGRDLLDGKEFQIPLTTILAENPERRDEIEYLIRYFTTLLNRH